MERRAVAAQISAIFLSCAVARILFIGSMVQAGSLGGGLQLAKVTTALRLLDEAIRVLAQPVRTLLIAFEVGRHPSWVQRRFTASVGLYHSLVAGRLGQKPLEPALGYCLPSMQERAGMFGTPGEDRWWRWCWMQEQSRRRSGKWSGCWSRPESSGCTSAIRPRYGSACAPRGVPRSFRHPVLTAASWAAGRDCGVRHCHRWI